jgi:hypothetical protein
MVTEVGDGYAVLADGRTEADAVVWSVGVMASEFALQICDELDHLDRAPTDQRLRALPEVFVAGDTAAEASDHVDHGVGDRPSFVLALKSALLRQGGDMTCHSSRTTADPMPDQQESSNRER